MSEVWPFVARTDEQHRFVSVLNDAAAARAVEGASSVLLLEGLGGFGKTELTHRFAAIASGGVLEAGIRRRRFLVVQVDWQDERGRRPPAYPASTGPQLLTVLTALHEAITAAVRDQHSGTSKLRRVASRVRRRDPDNADRAFDSFAAVAARSEALADLAAREEAAASQRQDLVATALSGVAKTATAATLGPPSAAVAAPGIDSAAKLVAIAPGRRGRRSLQARAIDERLRPEEALARTFALGLQRLSRHRPIVLLLDTYEIIAPVGRWLRDASRIAGPRVVWVFAGRQEPERSAADASEAAAFRRELPEGRLRIIPMTVFNDDTVRRLLITQLGEDVVDPELVGLVMAVTRGIPIAVRLVAGLVSEGRSIEEVLRPVTPAGDGSQVVRGLAERYLKHVLEDETLRDDAPLLYGMALLYADRADPEVLGALWGTDTASAEALATLSRRHDFVLTATRRLHQEVRDTIRSYLLDAVRREDVRPANTRARDRLRRRVRRQAGATVEQQLQSESWRANAAALVWHTFWIDNGDGLELVAEMLPPAALQHPAFARELIGIAGFFFDTLTEDQKMTLRGFGTMLSFGPFVDGWLERRSSDPRALKTLGPFARLRDEATPADREAALRFLVDRADTPLAVMADLPPRRSLSKLLAARFASQDDPPERLRLLEEAVAGLAVDGPFAREAAQAADAVRRTAIADDATPDGLPVAIAAARLAASYAPDDPARWRALSRALKEANEFEAAIEALDRAAELEDEGSRARADRALLLMQLSELERATAEWEAVLALEPTDRVALANRVLCLASLGRTDEALESVRSPSLRDDAKAWRLLGERLVEAGAEMAALEVLDRAVELDAQDPRGYAARGLAHARREDFESALPDWEMAISLDPDNKIYRASRASTLVALERVDEALEEFARPGVDAEMDTWWSFIQLLRFHRHYEPALEAVTRVLAVQPRDVRARVERASILMLLERFEEALGAWDAAIELDAGPLAVADRALTLVELGRIDEAMAAHRETTDLQDLPRPWLLLARRLASCGHADAALEAAERAVTLAPESMEALVARADAYAMLDRYDEALADLQRAIALDPDEPSSYTNLAMILGELGRLDEARAALEQRLRLTAEDALVPAVMLALLNRASKPEAAAESARTALTLDGTRSSPFYRAACRAIAYAMIGDVERSRAEAAASREVRGQGDAIPQFVFALLRDPPVAGYHYLLELKEITD